MNIFEIATKNKVRFMHNGVLSVEDLWDLPLEALDSVYKKLRREVKSTQEESLLAKRSADDKLTDLKIEIIKHIVITKQNDVDEASKALEKKQLRAKLLDIKAKKDEESLMNKTSEEIDQMLKEL